MKKLMGKMFSSGDRKPEPPKFDALEEAAGKKLIFSETRTPAGERAYSVLKAAEQDMPALLIPAHYNGSPVIRIENRAFCGNGALMQLTLPKTLTSIGVFAFAFCAELASVELPDSLACLGGRAFYGCANLAKVSLGKSLRTLRNGLFVGCKSLKEIELPDSAVGIGNETFAYCEELERVSIGRGVLVIGENTFSECPKLKKIEYRGTREDWNKIKTDATSARFLRTVKVFCLDGEIGPF